MLKPIKPKKPSEPREPQEFFDEDKTIISLYNYDQYTLQELIDMAKDNGYTDLNNVKFELEFYEDYGSIYSESKLFSVGKVKNLNYDTEYKVYLSKKTEFNKKMIDYDKKCQQYAIDLVKYEKEKAKREKEARRLQFEELKKEFDE